MTALKPIYKIPEYVSSKFELGNAIEPRKLPYHPLITIYLLRLSIALRDQLPDTALLELFDLEELGNCTGLLTADFENNEPLDDEIGFFKKESMITTMKKRLQQLLAQDMEVHAPLFRNLEALAAEFLMSDAEKELMCLSLLLFSHKKCSIWLESNCSPTETTTILDFIHVMTLRKHKEIKLSLNKLYRAGWIEPVEYLDPSRMVITPLLFCQFLQRAYSQKQIRTMFFRACQASTLSINAFPDLQKDINLVVPFLQQAIHQGKTGINILIHGGSALAKKELAKLINSLAGTELFEASTTAINGDRLLALDQFSTCQSTQVWLDLHKKIKGLVLLSADNIFSSLDEFEDLWKQDTPVNTLKVQIENNTHPVIWVIDDPHRIPSELLELFHFSFQVNEIPVEYRFQKIKSATKSLKLEKQWQIQLSQRTDIPLNQIYKAAKMVKMLSNVPNLDGQKTFEQILDNHCQFSTQQVAMQRFKPVTQYDLSFANTDTSLSELLAGFNRHPFGSLCLYGAPGTGKTAFAKYLADQTGKPIHIKRASSIFDKYIGETEKAIAEMFSQAQKDGAILLIDEADSFLSDRCNTRHNWERSFVNELLQQMEDFEGLFICTTNLMERMDPASLRRFDYKIKFDYLNQEQRWRLFVQESQRLGAILPTVTEELKYLQKSVLQLTKLTGGDFAVVSRQARLHDKPLTLHQMLDSLTRECKAKGESFNSIGFVH